MNNNASELGNSSTTTLPVPMCLQTHSGLQVDLNNPRPEMFCLEDIAIALSRIPRFNGHTVGKPYYVAMHSVWVSQYLLCRYPKDPRILETAIYGLLHDAHEAYTGDIPTPIKRLEDFKKPIKMLEHRIQTNIYIALGLKGPDEEQRKLIAYADEQALALEATHLMIDGARRWNLPELDIPRQWLYELYPSKLETRSAEMLIANYRVLQKNLHAIEEEKRYAN